LFAIVKGNVGEERNNRQGTSVVCVQVDGNQWKVSTLGKAMLAGMAASLIPIAALFFFNDNRSLGVESEAHNRSAAASGEGETLSGLGEGTGGRREGGSFELWWDCGGCLVKIAVQNVMAIGKEWAT